MKNYFIANGEVLNTNMSIEEMELRAQESLDESTSGMAQFKIKEGIKEQIDTITNSYNKWLYLFHISSC